MMLRWDKGGMTYAMFLGHTLNILPHQEYGQGVSRGSGHRLHQLLGLYSSRGKERDPLLHIGQANLVKEDHGHGHDHDHDHEIGQADLRGTVHDRCTSQLSDLIEIGPGRRVINL
jgi:hypothetical protein